jgi:hypothetical protein
VVLTAASGATLDSFSVVVPHASAPTVVVSVNGESGVVVLEETSGSVIPSNFVPLTTPLAGGIYQASAGQFVILSDSGNHGGSVYLPTVASAGKGGVVAFKVAVKAGDTSNVLFPNSADSGVTIDGYESISYGVNIGVGVFICDGPNGGP